VVVAAADGAELRMRLVTQRTRGFGVPTFVSIVDEGRVIVTLRIFAAHAERGRVPDVVHDAAGVGAYFRRWDVETHGLVAAGDIEADGGGADAVLRGDDATDGNAVAEVTVGHERHVIGGAGAELCLLERVLFVSSPAR